MRLSTFVRILFCLFLPFSSIAQHQSEENIVELQMDQWSSWKYEKSFNINEFGQPIQAQQPISILLSPSRIKIENIAPFLSFSARWEDESLDAGKNAELWIRFSRDSLKWGSWKMVTASGHAESGQSVAVSALDFLPPHYRFYQIRIVSNKLKKGQSIQRLQLNFFSPGNITYETTSTTNTNLQSNTEVNNTCACPLPSFVNRVGWGNPQGANSVITGTPTITHMVVHHSAGSNVSTNWAAVVLSIHQFHITTSGFSDIGYNWLIAPDGTLFEGRRNNGQDVTGAHFCGFNAGTMGICMIGTYSSETITNEARNTLTRLLGWRACQSNIDPTTSSFHNSSNRILNHIAGHRDGCATECPGTQLYGQLTAIRTGVRDYIQGGCVVTSLPNYNLQQLVQIIPNPTQNGITQLIVNSPQQQTLQYRLITQEGQVLYQSPREWVQGTWQKSITALSNQASGWYYLQVFIGKEQITKLVIKP